MPSPKFRFTFALPVSLLLSLFLSACNAGGHGGGGGGGGNGGIVTPGIQVLSANSGPVGAAIRITGSNFGAAQGGSTVTFNGTAATTIESWSANSITVLVPSGATTGNVVVTIAEVTNNGTPEQVVSNGIMFTVTPGAGPHIDSLTPNSGPVGATVLVAGSNFGSSPGTGGVGFPGASTPAPLVSWSDTSITVTVPQGATTGDVTVLTANTVLSNGVLFTVIPPPTISSLNPTSGPVGTPVTITGTNFGASQGSSTVTFNGTAATVSSWSATSIVVTVPAGAITGQVDVTTVNGTATSATVFKVTLDSCPLSALGKESLFNGIYAGTGNGWFDPVSGVQGPYEGAAAWHANGSGSILAGEADAGVVAAGATQTAPKMVPFTGCYNLGSDLRGLMIWNLSGGGTAIFAIAVRADGTSGRTIEADDSNPSASPGVRQAGYFELQAPGITATNAPVAFSLTGWSPNGSNSDYRRSAAIGVISDIIFGSPTASNGTADIAFTNHGTGTQINVDNQAFTATFTAPDSLGRGTATISFANVTGLCTTAPCPLTLHFAYYLGDPGRFFLQSTDTPDNNGHSLDNGEAIPQSSPTFSNGSLSRAVFQMTGADLSSGHADTDTAAGLIINSPGSVTVYLDENSLGPGSVGTNAITGGSINISSNGMGSITFGPNGAFSNAPAAFSVAMYGQNAGFIMEGTQASVPTPSDIFLGDFAPQTIPAGGFVDGTFSGLYILGTDHPSDTISSDTVGSVSTPSPQTSPASFSGKSDSTSGPGCSSGCLATDQTVSATYGVDANGRFPINFTSPSANPAVGWLRDNDAGQADKDAVILSNIGSPYAPILKAFQ